MESLTNVFYIIVGKAFAENNAIFCKSLSHKEDTLDLGQLEVLINVWLNAQPYFDPPYICLSLSVCLSVSLSPSGYVDVGVIPEGARDILVREVEEAGNFLALRSVRSEDYFLNGNYIIQWNGEYEAGDTTFFYERDGNMENLTAPGPTREPVMIQVPWNTTHGHFGSVAFSVHFVD